MTEAVQQTRRLVVHVEETLTIVGVNPGGTHDDPVSSHQRYVAAEAPIRRSGRHLSTTSPPERRRHVSVIGPATRTRRRTAQLDGPRRRGASRPRSGAAGPTGGTRRREHNVPWGVPGVGRVASPTTMGGAGAAAGRPQRVDDRGRVALRAGGGEPADEFGGDLADVADRGARARGVASTSEQSAMWRSQISSTSWSVARSTTLAASTNRSMGPPRGCKRWSGQDRGRRATCRRRSAISFSSSMIR